jgi:hypothetical protein
VSIQVRRLRLAKESAPVAAVLTSICLVRGLKDTEDLEFAKTFDQDSNLKLWEEE